MSDLLCWMMGVQPTPDGKWRGTLTDPWEQESTSPESYPDDLTALRWSCEEAVKQMKEATRDRRKTPAH